MNLFSLLSKKSKPITIGIIGAGKFATMFFAQALKIPSIHIVGVVDIHPENAKSNMEMVGWDPSAFETSNLSDAFSCGKTFISDNEVNIGATEDKIMSKLGSRVYGVNLNLLIQKIKNYVS